MVEIHSRRDTHDHLALSHARDDGGLCVKQNEEKRREKRGRVEIEEREVEIQMN